MKDTGRWRRYVINYGTIGLMVHARCVCMGCGSDVRLLYTRTHTHTPHAHTQLSHAKEATQGELTRATTAKAKLESLCRELQKQNKAIQV